MMFPKNKPIRDEAYLRRVGALPCMIPKCPYYKEEEPPHHLLRAEPAKGMGTKLGDNWAVPMCWRHHRQLHDHEQGEIDFFESHNLDYEVDVKGLAKQLWSDWNDNRANNRNRKGN